MVQEVMVAIQEQVVVLLINSGFSAHERLLAMEALLWMDAAGSTGELVTPQRLLQWVSHGGGSAAAAAQLTFADPWPAHTLGSLLKALHRRCVRRRLDKCDFGQTDVNTISQQSRRASGLLCFVQRLLTQTSFTPIGVSHIKPSYPSAIGGMATAMCRL